MSGELTLPRTRDAPPPGGRTEDPPPLRAVRAVRDAARARTAESTARIRAIAPDLDVEATVAAIAGHGRITLNFHPDRLLADGRTVAAAMAADGLYRSQFETRVSNGGRTAYPGGDRDEWERRMFAGAYQVVGARAADRPKYGGLNLARHADGASPRFGSCHIRLRPAANARATFSVGDSFVHPTDLGTVDEFGPVLAGLLERAAATGVALGRPGTAAALLRDLADPIAPLGRVLDDYLEAQVHGVLDLAESAEAAVLDPSFRGTAAGDSLAALADRCGFAVEWHAGYAIAPDAIPPDFRGDHVPPFAAHLAERYGVALLDAALIGRAAADAIADPDGWSAWGGPDELLQHVKYVWHALVAYG